MKKKDRELMIEILLSFDVMVMMEECSFQMLAVTVVMVMLVDDDHP